MKWEGKRKVEHITINIILNFFQSPNYLCVKWNDSWNYTHTHTECPTISDMNNLCKKMCASSWVLAACVNDSDPSISICARRVSSDGTRHWWNKNNRNNVHQKIDRTSLVPFPCDERLRLSSLFVLKRLGGWRICRIEEGNENIFWMCTQFYTCG